VVLIARSGGSVFAIGAECTHYHGPLAEGALVGDTVAARGTTPASACAPAKQCARRRSTRSRAGEWKSATERSTSAKSSSPQGGGRARARRENLSRSRLSAAVRPETPAAEMLRREGYAGPVTMLSADDAAPYDRPNLSKDYLAGNAPEEWILLRSPEFYAEQGIELKLSARVAGIDTKAHELRLENRLPSSLWRAVAGRR
jgi:hypothetical protein